MPTLFIGLGPRNEVSEADLLAKLDEVDKIDALRMRGECAFCDVASTAIGDGIIRSLHGVFIKSTKLNVQWSGDGRKAAAPSGSDAARSAARAQKHEPLESRRYDDQRRVARPNARRGRDR